jgi:hypothetical protein
MPQLVDYHDSYGPINTIYMLLYSEGKSPPCAILLSRDNLYKIQEV